MPYTLLCMPNIIKHVLVMEFFLEYPPLQIFTGDI